MVKYFYCCFFKLKINSVFPFAKSVKAVWTSFEMTLETFQEISNSYDYDPKKPISQFFPSTSSSNIITFLDWDVFVSASVLPSAWQTIRTTLWRARYTCRTSRTFLEYTSVFTEVVKYGTKIRRSIYWTACRMVYRHLMGGGDENSGDTHRTTGICSNVPKCCTRWKKNGKV